jgi:hypothetical protein
MQGKVTLQKSKKDSIIISSKDAKKPIELKFLSESDNIDKLLAKINKRSAQLSKKPSDEKKIDDYDKYEKQICYDGKNVELPDMILTFNSKRRVLKMPGYPMFMKEIAEIFECGQLEDFRQIDFIKCFERYASIQ